MSTAPGRWRLRIDIHLDLTATDDVDQVLAVAATRINQVLADRNAKCGAYRFQTLESLRGSTDFQVREAGAGGAPLSKKRRGAR